MSYIEEINQSINQSIKMSSTLPILLFLILFRIFFMQFVCRTVWTTIDKRLNVFRLNTHDTMTSAASAVDKWSRAGWSVRDVTVFRLISARKLTEITPFSPISGQFFHCLLLCPWHTYQKSAPKNGTKNRYQFLTRLACTLVPNFYGISF